MKLTTIRHAVFGTVGASTLAFFATTAFGSETWTAYTYSPSTKLHSSVFFQEFAEDITVATNGELVIEANLGGSLPISVVDMSQAVSDNIVQFGSDAYYQGFLPLAGVLRLPMLISNDEEYDKALEIVYPYLEEEWAKVGITLMGSYTYPLVVIYSNGPVTRLSDLEDKKIRVLSEEAGEFVKEFGGIPVTIATPEVSTALQQGVVDAIFAATAGGGEIWGALVEHKYAIGPDYVPVFYLANTEALEALPADQQELLRKEAFEMGDALTEHMRNVEGSVDEAFIAEGKTVTPAHPDDLADMSVAMVKVWDSWAEANGPEAAKVLTELREALGK